VEQRRPDGAWHELDSRHLNEFRARGARPRAAIRREFTVPVDSHGAALRIAMRGVGQVAVSRVEVTDGLQTRRDRSWARRIVLGSRAPRRGLPALDWARNAGVLRIAFAA